MKLSFYGAAGEVTGSNYLLKTSQSKVMVDCGAFQGGKDSELKNMAPFMFDPRSVNAMVLTHAHLDHVGRLAKLVKDGFTGDIYATPPTIELAKLIMEDSATIMSHEEMKFGDQPMFRAEDVAKTIEKFKPIKYNERAEIAEGVEVNLVDAGHILGSASVEMWADNRKILFSGDIGNAGAPIINDPVRVEEADYVICESTYGGRTHESAEEQKRFLDEVVDLSVAKNGVLLIPAFALERSQQLLYSLHQLLEEREIPDIPVFLDSPLAIKATKVFKKFPEYFDEEAKGHVDHSEDFFDLPSLKLTLSVEESKKINTTNPPKIIIAGSGMMTGGRIKFHLKEYLGLASTTVFVVGYQAEGTLGRRILDGAKSVDLFGERIQVKAQVKAQGAFSAHADEPQLLHWLSGIKSPVKEIYLTHGDNEARDLLEVAIGKKMQVSIEKPRFSQTINLE